MRFGNTVSIYDSYIMTEISCMAWANVGSGERCPERMFYDRSMYENGISLVSKCPKLVKLCGPQHMEKYEKYEK